MNLSKLEQHPFLKALTAKQRQQVLACGNYQHFEPGSWLSQQHQPANQLYLLLEGQVQLLTLGPRGRDDILESLGPGDTLGWSWFTNPQQWYFSARASAPVDCFSCNGSALRSAMEADHELGYAVLKQLVAMLAQRIQAARLHGLDVYSSPNEEAS